jgi:3-hydroxybutyryl-CoA dehydrogenase
MPRMSYTLPPDVDQRPVAVIGAGTLGARIALMFSAGGSAVRIVNRSRDRAEAAKRFADEQAAEVRAELGLTASRSGEVEIASSMDDGVPGAWLVIESVSERLDLKRRVFGDLDRLADPDAVLATNSSSHPSSEMLDEVRHPERVLNIHFLMPPQFNAVELMSSGRTDEDIIPALVERLPSYGLLPFRVLGESVGFIFNRVWAAIKREALMAVEEGVTTPADLDRIFTATLGAPAGPFRLMDQVGLDVVLDIEEHYAAIREGIPEGPRTLLRGYVDRGDLGVKTGRGFYDDYAS